jgi:hypothetical protein
MPARAGDVIRNLSDVKKNASLRLSPTALSCYTSCPRSYFFRYVLGAPVFSSFAGDEKRREDEKKDEHSLNSVFRGLVAHSLFEDEILDNKDILRNRVLARIRHSGQLIGASSIDAFCEEVYINLQHYRKSATFEDSSFESYNEVSFEVDIGAIKLFGVIDKLYRSKADGSLKILDFKTNAVGNLSQASGEVRKHRYDLQAQCYCFAAEKITGEKIENARLFFSHIPSEKREIIIPFDADARRNLLSLPDSLSCDTYSSLSSPACETCPYNSCCDI